MLEKFFHLSDRGTTAGQEVKAGISVFLISVCALFMNIQIIMEAYSGNIPYCGIYLGATITAFLGTLILGFLCNLPLVQTSSLGMSTILISMMGVDSGLTYANLLAVTFVAAVIYLVVMVIPATRKFVFHLIPDSVRKALPAAMGLYIAYVALDKMGITNGMELAAFSEDAMGGATIAPYMRLCVFAGLIAFALVLFNKKRKAETPVFTGLYVALLIFFLIAAVAGGIAFNYVFTQNRIWVGVNPDKLGEMYTIGAGLGELSIGEVFKSGFDFSAFTAAGGNVAGLFVRGILMFLFLGVYESEASVLGAEENGEIIPGTAEEKEVNYEEAAGKFLLANAITNVIAPIFGAAPVSVAKQSSVASTDGGKTGLTSVVCAIGYLIAMFTWIPFVILATYTASVPEYGHAGFVFPNVIKAGFQIVDAIMLVLGLMMIKSVKKMADASVSEWAAYGSTIVMTVFTQNIAYGVAAGVIVSVFLSLVSFKKEEIKKINTAQYAMAVLSVVLMVLSFAMPTLGGTGTAGTETASSENTAGFQFDGTTGDFSFTGEEGTDYYTVWVYSVDDEGNESDSYVAASQRLTGTGEITGNVDISTLPFGEYHAVLNTFMKEGSNPDVSVADFGISGKLTAPEFMYSQDGTTVKITLFADTLSLYNQSEKFTDLAVNVYDTEGNVVSTETITPDDLVVSQMGPFTNYSCEKELTLDEGTYQISLTATGDGKYASASDESEKLDLVVAAGTTSEGKTSGYVESQDGSTGGPTGGGDEETVEGTEEMDGTEEGLAPEEMTEQGGDVPTTEE